MIEVFEGNLTWLKVPLDLVTSLLSVGIVLWIRGRDFEETFLRRAVIGIALAKLLGCVLIYTLLPLNRPLTKRDLKVKSPYNTYLHPGLPPGPICNPGLASIKAALWPAQTDYLYFVAQRDGSHIFSRTNREHINARRRVRQGMEF